MPKLQKGTHEKLVLMTCIAVTENDVNTPTKQSLEYKGIYHLCFYSYGHKIDKHYEQINRKRNLFCLNTYI